jgi:hypothetical protein
VLRSSYRIVLAAILCALVTTVANGQTAPVLNPRYVEFDPSADHSAVSASGDALVSRYDFQVFLLGATAPITTANLGKPTPGADGKIRVDFSALLVAWPLANGTYEARVAAVGTTGSGVSDLSNAFDFQAVAPPVSCSYALSAASQSAAAGGGSTSVTVTASDSSCSWTASSGAAWLTVSPTSGTGTGSVTVTTAANGGAARMATATIGGQTYSVTQAPAPCGVALSAAAMNAAAAGSSSTVGVTATLQTCSWTASSGVAWVTVSPSSGTGSGAVTVTTGANAGAARTGTATIGGQGFTVMQAAAPCSIDLSSTSMNAAAGGTTATVGVNANLGTCGWAASTGASWVTVSPQSGTGSGTVTVSAQPNIGAARVAMVTIGERTYTVSQAAVSCGFSLSSVSLGATAAGARATVGVTASFDSCGWTASSGASWISLSAAGGTGSGSVALDVAPNAGGARTAIVTIAGQAYTVSQEALSVCSFGVGATSVNVAGTASSGTVALTASAPTCGWTANSSVSWITLSTAGGAGSASVGYSVAKNGAVTARTGTLSVGGQVVTISQAAGTRPNAPRGVKIK